MKKEIKIDAGGTILPGILTIPTGSTGIVIFVHGSGSSRFSPRNTYVAEMIQKRGMGTLLFDLLTSEEEVIDNQTRKLRFDIEFLANRLVSVTKWLQLDENLKNMNIGFYGASTGGGAAIVAAVILKGNSKIKTVVSRGGRPDLAGNALELIKIPTLLIVGGNDDMVIELNKKAFNSMINCKEKELKIIPGATHLFEEYGKLEEVAKISSEWFKKYI